MQRASMKALNYAEPKKIHHLEVSMGHVTAVRHELCPWRKNEGRIGLSIGILISHHLSSFLKAGFKSYI